MAAAYKNISGTMSSTKRKAKDMADEDDDRPVSGTARYKQRVLILSSRGVTFRHRHILNDLYSMLPHSRKESKLDTKTKLYQLNELAELYNCNNVMFFEARKGKDLYLWMSKAPNGPTVKMHMQNLHTMSELHFPGNCLKGSRPILSFDKAFTDQPHLKVIKELLTHAFAVPKGSRKVKPFIDHVLGFTIADNKIWARCYEIKETQSSTTDPTATSTSTSTKATATSKASLKQAANDLTHGLASQAKPSAAVTLRDTDISLVEIGPRFVLTPIVILESSFGGPLIYENREFVSPNQVRSQLRRAKEGKRARRDVAEDELRARRDELGLNTNPYEPGADGRRKRRRDGEVVELDESVLFA